MSNPDAPIVRVPRYTSVFNFFDCRLPQLNVGDGTNEMEVTADGTVIYKGTATTNDDLRFSFTSSKLGANAKPDFDYTNIGLLFPQNSATEIIYCIAQMPHGWKIGSTIFPHIHWQQMNTNNVVFKMEYKWFNNGGIVPAAFTTLTAATATDSVFTYTSGNLSQINKFGGIAGTNKELSSKMLIKIYREDNVDGGAGLGDALAWEFDIHWEKDTNGSATEYAK